MKKILILCIIALNWGVALAQELTVGDTLSLYFNEIFPIVYTSHSNVVLKYSDIGNKPWLRSALQRGIYYSMIANTSSNISPDKPMTENMFSAILYRHFWVTIQADNSPLTLDEYGNYMKSIRFSYAFTLLKSINASQNIKTSEVISVPDVSRLTTTKKYYILDEVYNTLKNNHLNADTLSDDEMIYGASEWLATGTWDKYTQFFPPESSNTFQQSLEGKIAGIGVILDWDSKNGLTIQKVIEKSPADQAGLQPQDIILKIDSIVVDNTDGIEDEILRLRGKENTPVTLNILSGKTIKNVTIIRAIISIPLAELTDTWSAHLLTYREVAFWTDVVVKKLLEDFLQNGKKRLIIDMRDNPGGSMLETRNILNFFIDKWNPLVILKNKDKQNIYSATLPQMTDWSQYEIIILVNKNTASAAEVIAATLREYMPKNVKIFWERTFGKWVVQELISFDDNSLLKYTVAEWITPIKKISIDQVGIKPDITISFNQLAWKNDKLDSQLETAEKYVFTK